MLFNILLYTLQSFYVKVIEREVKNMNLQKLLMKLDKYFYLIHKPVIVYEYIGIDRLGKYVLQRAETYIADGNLFDKLKELGKHGRYFVFDAWNMHPNDILPILHVDPKYLEV